MDNNKAFKALVGSNNYNLSDETSDKDYKTFIFPTYDDIYHNNKLNKHISKSNMDMDFYDIRELEKLLWKSNVNFTEVLFSKELKMYDNPASSVISDIFEMKEEIARMNLPYLYDASIGMFKNKMHSMNRGTALTLQSPGYDTKSAMSAYRILDFLVKYAQSEFMCFEKSIRYEGKEREFLLSIKKGAYKYNEVMYHIEVLENLVESCYKQEYKMAGPDEETKNELKILLMKAVWMNLQEE